MSLFYKKGNQTKGPESGLAAENSNCFITTNHGDQFHSKAEELVVNGIRHRVFKCGLTVAPYTVSYVLPFLKPALSKKYLYN